MTAADDRRLIQESLAGEPRSFEVLVDRYYKVLYNVALRVLHDAEDARDATQSTFLKAYQKLGTFDPEHKFFSWIYRILMNEALNQLQRRRPMEPLDATIVAPQKGPDEELDASRTSDAIGAALMRVSLDHREVLILRHFLALSYLEISSVLGLPEKTVKSRLFAARRHLGDLLLERGAAA
jgi:RNA polymerase sigma-70 factor (ECF subfamily)